MKTELKSIYEEKGKQAMFSVKCRWIEYGERPTNLEKSICNEKKLSASFVYKMTLLHAMRL